MSSSEIYSDFYKGDKINSNKWAWGAGDYVIKWGFDKYPFLFLQQEIQSDVRVKE